LVRLKITPGPRTQSAPAIVTPFDVTPIFDQYIDFSRPPVGSPPTLPTAGQQNCTAVLIRKISV
jgi:hypothetical protein